MVSVPQQVFTQDTLYKWVEKGQGGVGGVWIKIWWGARGTSIPSVPDIFSPLSHTFSLVHTDQEPATGSRGFVRKPAGYMTSLKPFIVYQPFSSFSPRHLHFPQLPTSFNKENIPLTFYTPTLVFISSTLIPLHFLWYWQGEFVWQSGTS